MLNISSENNDFSFNSFPKINLKNVPYMGVLVMWPGPFEQTFVEVNWSSGFREDVWKRWRMQESLVYY